MEDPTVTTEAQSTQRKSEVLEVEGRPLGEFEAFVGFCINRAGRNLGIETELQGEGFLDGSRESPMRDDDLSRLPVRHIPSEEETARADEREKVEIIKGALGCLSGMAPNRNYWLASPDDLSIGSSRNWELVQQLVRDGLMVEISNDPNRLRMFEVTEDGAASVGVSLPEE